MALRGMNTRLMLILGVVLTLSGRSAMGQPTPKDVMLQIQDAVAHGDVDQLLDRANKGLEIDMLSRRRTYSPGQARYVLRRFFKKHPPRRFILIDYYESHKGWFAEGKYWYGKSKRPLQIYLQLRWRNGHWDLREIIIENNMRH